MKYLIFWFSGTGNTLKIAELFAQTFRQAGIETDLFEITDSRIKSSFSIPKLSEYKQIGIAYPVHAFNAPEQILKFARRLPLHPPKDSTSVFLIYTSGEPLRLNNGSSLKLRSILSKKGYDVKWEFHYVMPYNIIFRHTKQRAWEMWNVAQKRIPKEALQVLNETAPTNLALFPFAHIFAWLFRIEHWGSKVNGLFYSADMDKCIRCGRCMRECPTQNISLKKEKLAFSTHCMMCMRCSFHCPVDAISIGLFNKWKVNGAYSFTPPEKPETDLHPNYCRKAYDDYFSRYE